MVVVSLDSFLAANYSTFGAMHAIANAISARLGLRYGLALAMVAPEVCKVLYKSNKARFDELLKIFGEKTLTGLFKNLFKNLGIVLPCLKGKLPQGEIERLARVSMGYGIREMTLENVEAVIGRLG